jgi:SHO1 osmosensor
MATFEIGNILGNPVFLGSLGLAVIGWVIALAGAAAASNNALRFTWFVIFYIFFLIIGIMSAVATDSVRHYRLVIMTSLGISITFVCEQITFYIYFNASEFQAIGAGFIFVAIIQFVWLFLFGGEEGSFPHRFTNSVSINKTPEVHPNVPGARIDSNLPMRSTQTDHHMSQVIVSPNAEYSYKAKALYDYQQNPEDPNELSFSKGEILDIVDNKGKWWQARKADGTVGIAPSNYLQII